MRVRFLLAGVLAVTAAFLTPGARESPPGRAHALEWFSPWVTLDDGDRRDLARDEVVAEILPASGMEIAVFLAGRIEVSPDTFLQRIRDSETLWKSRGVPHVVQFSDPPRLEDLAALTLEEGELRKLGSCRPGDCDLKLTGPEIDQMRQVAESGGNWRQEAHVAFRKLVLARIERYQRDGMAGIGRLHDHDEPVDAAAVGARLLDGSPWLRERVPSVARYLASYPRGSLPGSHSLFYWLKTTHTPKPTVQVVHSVIQPFPAPGSGVLDVLVVSRQILSTHYVNGSLATSVLLTDENDPGRRYLGYVNRAEVDGVAGWFSGLRRFFVQRRVRSQARELFDLQRRRLEGTIRDQGSGIRDQGLGIRD